MNESADRSEVYAWARRNGMYEPYDFAVCNEDLWGDPEALAEAAKAWERKGIAARKAVLEEEMQELRSRAAILDADLERIEDGTRWPR